MGMFFCLVACTQKNVLELRFVNPDGTQSPAITAEIARTPEEVQLGLMYRRELERYSGMLFEFPDEKPRTFWMKNTYLELDMIFISKEMKVVSIVERAVPLTETLRESKLPAKYVLEIQGGQAQTWGIIPGSQLKLLD